MAATHFSGPVVSAAGFQTGEPGAAGSQNVAVGRRVALTSGVAATVLTITVPNGNHSGAIFLDIVAYLSGGADIGESARCASGAVAITRQTGTDTVAVVATLALAQIATVAAGATLTLAYGVGTVTGAIGGTQTVAVTVTITASGGTEVGVVTAAKLLNGADSGITMVAA